MRQIIKQRIVGAVVLIALGVIFLPFLFTLEPPQPIDTASQIPTAPDIEPVIVAGPQRGEGFEPPKSPEEAFLPPDAVATGESATPVDGDIEAPPSAAEESSARAGMAPSTTEPPATEASEERPALAGNTLETWVVQVASFRDQTVANGMRDKLQVAGHKAYVRSAMAGGSETHRVFVGPVALKDRAEADKLAIDRAFKVDSLVVRFEP